MKIRKEIPKNWIKSWNLSVEFINKDAKRKGKKLATQRDRENLNYRRWKNDPKQTMRTRSLNPLRRNTMSMENIEILRRLEILK